MSNHPRTVAPFILVLVAGCLSAGSVMLSGCASVSAPPSMPDDASAKTQKPCPQGSQGQSAQDCGKGTDTH
jgi:hypothetical protein